MRKSRFTESQILAVLKEGEAGSSVAEVSRKHAIFITTGYFSTHPPINLGSWLTKDYSFTKRIVALYLP